MALFTRIPLSGAPLGGRLLYGVAGSAPQTFDLRLYDAATRAPLGARRFTGVASFASDVAPLLRRALRFVPSSGSTGFCEATDRTLRVVAEATGTLDGTATAASRTFLPCAGEAAAPALLTSMPRERLLAPGECDELTLLHEGALTVTVTASDHRTTDARSYRTATGGLLLFRIAADDFAGAERLEVDAGPCGRIGYTLLPAPEGAQRLAWRTAEGSIEHYTFPVGVRTTIAAAKRRACGSEEHVATTTQRERRDLLRSACETGETLEALAGLLAAPQVWACTGGAYRPVDVLTTEAAIRRHGALGTFDIEIRSTAREALPWN